MLFPKHLCRRWKRELNVELHRRTGHARNKERNDSIVTERRNSSIHLSFVDITDALSML
jgi:hypothetical protein